MKQKDDNISISEIEYLHHQAMYRNHLKCVSYLRHCNNRIIIIDCFFYHQSIWFCFPLQNGCCQFISTKKLQNALYLCCSKRKQDIFRPRLGQKPCKIMLKIVIFYAWLIPWLFWMYLGGNCAKSKQFFTGNDFSFVCCFLDQPSP